MLNSHREIHLVESHRSDEGGILQDQDHHSIQEAQRVLGGTGHRTELVEDIHRRMGVGRLGNMAVASDSPDKCSNADQCSVLVAVRSQLDAKQLRALGTAEESGCSTCNSKPHAHPASKEIQAQMRLHRIDGNTASPLESEEFADCWKNRASDVPNVVSALHALNTASVLNEASVELRPPRACVALVIEVHVHWHFSVQRTLPVDPQGGAEDETRSRVHYFQDH